MTHASVPATQQSRLAAGTAATWHTGGATRLVVHAGRAWVTFDTASEYDAPRGGDWFVAAGDGLPVPPGCRLVIESAGAPGEPLVFGWRCAEGEPQAGWQAAIGQPWRELRASVRLAAAAGGRLVLGLARWGLSAGRQRPRRAACPACPPAGRQRPRRAA